MRLDQQLLAQGETTHPLTPELCTVAGHKVEHLINACETAYQALGLAYEAAKLPRPVELLGLLDFALRNAGARTPITLGSTPVARPLTPLKRCARRAA